MKEIEEEIADLWNSIWNSDLDCNFADSDSELEAFYESGIFHILANKKDERIKELEEENQNLKAMLADKNPNTCPLCEGEGTWEDNITLTNRKCPCCHGNGSL